MRYNSLTKENIIATIQFDKIQNKQQTYIAHLYSYDNSKIGDYKIYGDQWRIDSNFFKMKYWANIFGIDSKYALNRLEGRYKNIEDENNKKNISYSIEEHKIIYIFDLFIDIQYGSSVYKEIDINKKYIILKTPTGLIVRDKNIKNIKKRDSLFDKFWF
jgi:hypothetical protein